ncbi:MAG: urease accessory protein UreD [Cocleimonas sp.]
MSHPKDCQKTQGWHAHLNLGFKHNGAKTVLANRTQSGPLTVQRPFYPEGDVCHLYLLHPPGGVVGGDELHIDIALTDHAHTLITTPGATKFYRSGNSEELGKLAKQRQHLRVADCCALEWFPQENIFFDNTHTQLVTRVELEKNAQFMGWEINCYGRPASNELFENGKVLTRLELFRDDTPLILDSLCVNNMTGDNNALMSATSLNSYPCFGTFISTQVTPELLDKARSAVKDINIKSDNQQIGITLMDDVLVARCLGQYAEQISTTLKLVWTSLRPDILGRDTCQPRIWST